jgi:hypothetical protein
VLNSECICNVDIPSDHDAKPLDVLYLQFGSIVLLFAAVRWTHGTPWYEKRVTSRRLEVVLIADRGLLAAAWIQREDLVFEDKRILLAIGLLVGS